ncbi:MAG: AAA family ATPase [Pseudomonadota bacterium]
MVIDARPDTHSSDPYSAGCQPEVIAFLGNPESYSHATGEVQRIETHGALIFLAGPNAYKLKRAVRLPYLDFSTIAKREAACRNELKRNRHTAPDIYIDIVPVTREADGSLAIDGGGEAVDWLIVMNRFDQTQLFDNLAVQNRLDISVAEALADCIANYHAHAAQHPDSDGYEIVAQIITQIVSACNAAEKSGMQSATDLPGRMIVALNQKSWLLKARSKAGYVRLGHGDLHLRNIVLHNGKPTLFDAIEFDDALATIDVLYDLAFLLMDFWHRGLKAQANRCFNEYVSISMSAEALDGLALMPLFMALRASIRAMVAIDKLKVVSKPTADTELDCAEAQDYFALATQFLNTSDPVLIAVGGLSGTGKTTLAAALAPRLGDAPGALHLRSDVERKRMYNANPLERLPSHAYSSTASHCVYRRLCDRADHALQAGHSVIVDAVFLEPMYQHWIEQVARRAHCKFLGLWLEADRDQLIERVTARTHDASDATADVVRTQLNANDRFAECQSGGWPSIDTRGSRQDAVSRAERVISEQLDRALLSD